MRWLEYARNYVHDKYAARKFVQHFDLQLAKPEFGSPTDSRLLLFCSMDDQAWSFEVIKYARRDWVEAASADIGNDLAEFAITLVLASPHLRSEIIAELYRTCERVGMRPPYWSPPHLKLATAQTQEPFEIRPTPPDHAA